MFGLGKKRDVYDALFGALPPAAPREVVDPGPPVVAVTGLEPYRWSYDTGAKWQGGFGPTELIITDYWTLRQRSTQVFEKNMYARGIVRALVENEINVGLFLEAKPEELLLGKEKGSLDEWSEAVESRFQLWADEAEICDQNELNSFGALQQQIRLEALVAGDVLLLLRQDPRTKMPRLQMINGAKVQTPMGGGTAAPGNKITHGVEIDGSGRHVAFWVRQEDGTAKRLPAFGEKSGRRLAWLVYGTEKRVDDVRGKPLLSLVLQSLREIDRYRDSVQLKATINSMIATYITKTQDKPGTRMFDRAAMRKGADVAIDTTGKPRRFDVAEQIPGLVVQELQVGEEPHAFPSNGTDEKFGDFEGAIIAGIAWHFRIPPESLVLSFRSNYSASQAATNEFKSHIELVQTNFAEHVNRPIYIEWLLSQVLDGKIEAAGLIEAWGDPAQYDTFGAWVSSDWFGIVKPAIDAAKLVTGDKLALEEGLTTRAKVARERYGTKFSQNMRTLEIENLQLAKAMAPLSALLALQKAASQGTSLDAAQGEIFDVEPSEPADPNEPKKPTDSSKEN